MTDFEELTVVTPDGEKLHGYLVRPTNKSITKPVTVLSFHGNAGNIGHRLPIAGIISTNMGCNVLMVEYRGYGKSTGNPDERGLNIDAQTSLDYLRQHPDTMNTKIVVYGQSLGGAVSIQLVAKNQKQKDIKALILENTFTSIRALIPSVMPPARFIAPLCHQVWPSEDTIPAIRDVPVLFLSGLKDEIVPPSHMKALYNRCGAKPKVWRDFPEGTHNDTLAAPGYFQAIADFLQEHVGQDGPR